MLSRADLLLGSVADGTSEGVKVHLTCAPSIEKVYLRQGFSRSAAREQQQQQPELHAPARSQAEWDSSVAAVRAHLDRANGEPCCGHLRRQCAVCNAYSIVAAGASVLLKSCEVRYALFPVKLRKGSRNRPLLWALTPGKSLTKIKPYGACALRRLRPRITLSHTLTSVCLRLADEGGREARRRLASQDSQARAEAWMQNARAPRPSRVEVEQAALSAVTTGELTCKRCRKWTGDPRREHFHDGNDLTELQPKKYTRIKGPDHLSSLGLPPVCAECRC